MTALGNQQKENIVHVIESYLDSIQTVVPLPQERGELLVLENDIKLDFGVAVGFHGTLVGNLVLKAESLLFSKFGEVMFGMPLEGEMLQSFSGELGNMIAGGFATNISKKNQQIDITAPSIMVEPSVISGHAFGYHVPIRFEGNGHLDAFLLFNKSQ